MTILPYLHLITTAPTWLTTFFNTEDDLLNTSFIEKTSGREKHKGRPLFSGTKHDVPR